MAFIAFALTVPARAFTRTTHKDVEADHSIVEREYEVCTDGTMVPSRIELGTFATRMEADHHVNEEIFKFAKHPEYEATYGKEWNDNTFGPYKFVVKSDDFCVNRNKDFGGTIHVHFKGHIHFCIMQVD